MPYRVLAYRFGAGSHLVHFNRFLCFVIVFVHLPEYFLEHFLFLSAGRLFATPGGIEFLLSSAGFRALFWVPEMALYGALNMFMIIYGIGHRFPYPFLCCESVSTFRAFSSSPYHGAVRLWP